MQKLFTFLVATTMLISLNPAQDVGEFGEPVGSSFGVVAHNNTPEGFVSSEIMNVQLSDASLCVPTGIRGQCVEYARRWLISQFGVSFSDVDYAVNMWQLQTGYRVLNNEPVPIVHFKNQEAIRPPRVGDLLIYDTALAPVTGHVAVVVGVSGNEILLAEQNYMPGPWESDTYSRKVKYSANQQKCFISDVGVMGWLSFAKE